MTEPDKQDASTTSPEGSSQRIAAVENDPTGADDEEKLRQLVGDYENQIDEVAELIKRVRHEINNPLTGVLGQAQLLLREDLDEKTRKRVQTIEELAIRMRDIVGQLRNVQTISKS